MIDIKTNNYANGSPIRASGWADQEAVGEDMATREEGRLSRWSRLKQEDRERLAESVADAPGAAEVPAERADEGTAAKGAISGTAEGAIDPDDLPDIESLDGESDFTPFLQQGVPEHLHRLALRKLWTSDPVLANLDGLIDYDPDNMPFLKTVEQVAEKLLRERLRDAGGGSDGSDGDELAAAEDEPVSEADDVAEEPSTPATADGAASAELEADAAPEADEAVMTSGRERT